MPVTVHVDELHSEVAPAPSAGRSSDASERNRPPWEAEERWCEQRGRLEWLARRVCAVDFDD
jgi:hypothetical protein